MRGATSAFIFFLILKGTCAFGLSNPAVELSIVFEDRPKVGTAAALVVEAVSPGFIENCRLDLILPAGISLSKGTTSWGGDLKPGRKATIYCLVVVNRPGKFKIDALLKAGSAGQGHFTRSLYLTVTQSGMSMSGTGFTEIESGTVRIPAGNLESQQNDKKPKLQNIQQKKKVNNGDVLVDQKN